MQAAWLESPVLVPCIGLPALLARGFDSLYGPTRGVGGNAAGWQLCGFRPPLFACDPLGRGHEERKTLGYWIALAVALIVFLYMRTTLTRITIFEFEQGMKYRKGKFAGVLEAGRHWVYRPSIQIRKIDSRPRFVSIQGQDVLSSDGVTLKVSLAARYEIADANIAINKVENYQEALYLTLQLALREIIGQAKIDDVLARRDEFGRRLAELTSSQIEALGIRLLSVNLKDIMFPGDLKKMFAQVVQAQKAGLAALEKARGETAALRNLANAARMIESNPALMQLRLLQQLADSTGNTLVLGFPPSSTPLPVRAPEAEAVETKEIPPADEPA